MLPLHIPQNSVDGARIVAWLSFVIIALRNIKNLLSRRNK